jgi:hypothetical protein
MALGVPVSTCMNVRFALLTLLTLVGCQTVPPQRTADPAVKQSSELSPSPEAELSCSRVQSHRKSRPPESRPFTKEWPKSVANAAQRARLITSELTPEAQAQLEAADTPAKLQKLVLEILNKEGGVLHQYSFSASSPCALTKSYVDLGYRETVCLQSDGIVAGNNGDIQASEDGEVAFRSTITLWMLYVNCVGKACAVYAEGDVPEYLDSYFFWTALPDESSLLLAANSLTRLARACGRTKQF